MTEIDLTLNTEERKLLLHVLDEIMLYWKTTDSDYLTGTPAKQRRLDRQIEAAKQLHDKIESAPRFTRR